MARILDKKCDMINKLLKTSTAASSNDSRPVLASLLNNYALLVFYS